MRINCNVSALIANNALSKSNSRLTTSSERLSSGYKINSAKDNPSGIAIGHKMRAQIRALEQADQNGSEAISIVEIADGALTEVHDMLQRMNELAVKAANGTMSAEDRAMVDQELQQLKEEVERVAKDTEFNGQTLLDGTFDRKAYTDVTGADVTYFSDEVPKGEYSISFTVSGAGDTYEITSATINSTTAVGADAFLAGASVDYDGAKATFKDATGKEIIVYADKDILAAGTYDVTFDLTDIGPMRVQIGSNEGQVVSIRIPEVSLLNMGIEDTNTLTMEASENAIDEISEAISYISSVRSRLGAYQNRLEHTDSSLDISQEEMTSAYSRIMDLDMAEEMTEYTNLQVLVQAGTSILAQANERPQQVLQLLQ